MAAVTVNAFRGYWTAGGYGNIGEYSADYTYERSGNDVVYYAKFTYTLYAGYSPDPATAAISFTINGVTLSGTLTAPGSGQTKTETLGPITYRHSSAAADTVSGYLGYANDHTPNDWTAVVPAGGSFTVTYDADGGSVSPASETVNAGSALTLPVPTKSGYACTGWYTAAQGGTKAGAAGETYTPTADVTLYARWEPVSILHLAENGAVTTITNIQAVEDGAVHPVIGVYSVENGVVKQGV